MTRINLLPEEYRPIEGTPAARRYTIFVGVALIAALGFLFGFYDLIKLSAARDDAEQLKREEAGLAPQVKQFDTLMAEIRRLETFRDAIGKAWQERMVWSHKLGQLKEIVPSYIWIKQIEFKEPRGGSRSRKATHRGELTMKIVSATDDIDNVTNFFRILTGVMPPLTGPGGKPGFDIGPSLRYAQDFAQLGYGKISRVEFDEVKYEEKVGWETKVTMFVKLLESAKKPRGKTPPRGGAPQARK